MVISAELEERTRDLGGITQASYFLIIDEDGAKREMFVGKALKNCTFEDGHRTAEIHSDRRHLVTALSLPYSPPTPTILQYFSSTPLEDVVTGDVRSNIHPSNELAITRKILEQLAEIEPGIKTGSWEKLQKIGNHVVDPDVRRKIGIAYATLCPYAHAPAPAPEHK